MQPTQPTITVAPRAAVRWRRFAPFCLLALLVATEYGIHQGKSFSALAAAEGKAWPTLEREIKLYTCDHDLCAPLVQRSPVVTESSH